MHGVVIGGTHSGCGKTTVTLGIIAALKKKGLVVQSFKAGPDFIDSGLHRLITGRPSRNLDLWMCGEAYVRSSFNRHSAAADISVVEGVMGLYDGQSNGRYSTAALSDALNLPVILVVDAYGMAESAGAVVKGFVEYSRQSAVGSRLSFAGVIFNRVASESHYRRIKDSIQDMPVLGYLPRDLDFEIPHRHLGLKVAEENPISDKDLEKLAEAVLERTDVDLVMKAVNCPQSTANSQETKNKDLGMRTVDCRLLTIAVAYDKAFCFYYEDNLELLREAGAEIKTFSPISDSSIPEGTDAVYIGGGYPELYAEELSRNESMLKSISCWADSGRPLYAECGGLMFLSQGIYDFDGRFFRMSGVFPFETAMSRGRSKIGYREIVLKGDCILGRKGERFRGHEFHYSEIKSGQQSPVNRQTTVYSIKDSMGNDIGIEGYKVKNTLASYVHVHFGSSENIAENFTGFRESLLPDVSRPV